VPVQVEDQVVQSPQLNVPEQLTSAPCSMGPRQIIAWSGSTKNPMLITFTPNAVSGVTFFPSLEVGRAKGHHQRHGRSIMSVEEAHLAAEVRQGDGDVRRDGALAHAALPDPTSTTFFTEGTRSLGLCCFAGDGRTLASKATSTRAKLQRRERARTASSMRPCTASRVGSSTRTRTRRRRAARGA